MTKTRWDCHGLVDVSAYEISWNCWNRLWKVFSETHQNAACSSQPLSSSKLHLRQKARPNAVDLEDLGVDIEIKRNFVAWNLCSSEKTLWPGLAPPQHNMLEKKYSTIGCSFCKSHTHKFFKFWSVQRREKAIYRSTATCDLQRSEKDTGTTFWIRRSCNKSKQHSHTKH